MRVRRVADAPLRPVSEAYFWCYCQIDLRGTLPEDIAVSFGRRPCALAYTRDDEHMGLAEM